MRKIIASIMAVAMTVSMAAVSFGASIDIGDIEEEVVTEAAGDQNEETVAEGDYHIGIVTGSVSQSEDDRRGAEAFQAMYGEDRVTLAIYPDNFTEELETTIQTIVNMSDDPQMKAIIVNQAIPGTTEAFRQIQPSKECAEGNKFNRKDG